MGLLELFFGEPSASEKAARIVKNKRIPVMEKYLKIKNIYLDFFNNQLSKKATEANLELHYEQFMSHGYQDEVKYQKFLTYETENISFFYSFAMCSDINELVKQGLNLQTLNDNFASDVIKLKNSCGFNPKYDGTKFYNDKQVRQHVVKNINEFLLKCEQKQMEDIFGL